MKDIKKVSIENTGFHYIEEGRGKTILFIHGSLNDLRTWKQQINIFAEKYHVIAFSRRYHYPNKWEKADKPYSAVNEGRDIALFINALKLKDVTIIASSYGAYSSLYMTLERPEFVKVLVLGEPPILPWVKEIDDGKQHYNDFMNNAWFPAKNAFIKGDDENGVRLFINGVSGDGYYESLSPRAKSVLLDNAPELKLETLSDEIFPELSCDELNQINIPVLLVKGENSPAYYHMITDKLSKCLKDSEIKVIPGTSHGMHIQNPEFYNKTVLKFLSEVI